FQVGGPLADVAQHIIKTPLVREFLADRMGGAIAVSGIPGALLEEGFIDLPGARGAGAAGQLPFRLRRQTVMLPSGGSEPAAEHLRGDEAHVDHRIAVVPPAQIGQNVALARPRDSVRSEERRVGKECKMWWAREQ